MTTSYERINEEMEIIDGLIKEAIGYINAGTSDKEEPKLDPELIRNGIATLEFAIDRIKEIKG